MKPGSFLSLPVAALLLTAVVATFVACKGGGERAQMPSPVYQFVRIDTAALPVKHAVYVPVYSHIYTEDGNRSLLLGTTLSFRNTSYTDSLYLTSVVYYGSQGEVLRRYLDSVVLVRPMASVEFVVARADSKGGAGANFMLHWGARVAGSKPLVQSVMSETTAGVSLLAEGVEVQ